MLTKAIGRSMGSSWKMSSARYGGRNGLLLAVMIANLASVTLFGGGIMLLLVTAIEFTYALVKPDAFTWFSSEAASALAGYGGICFVASIVPMAMTSLINRFYRVRCKTCGR